MINRYVLLPSLISYCIFTLQLYSKQDTQDRIPLGKSRFSKCFFYFLNVFSNCGFQVKTNSIIF